ncbi:MAG: Fic family protein [Candidatus Methanoplasma sp.]|jgi:Fic family protein|nr:Fic family protein [Candidatus Methanoplasma sp.]
MNYNSVTETAKKWGLTDRAVRRYCSEGLIPGAFLTGKTWNVPEDAIPPERKNAKKFSDNDLLNILKYEKDGKIKGGIYHKVQISLTYNSNHIEGSKLTEDQTRRIFETNTIGTYEESLKVDDIVEAMNHFRCIDFIIDNAKKTLTENMIKTLHLMLKTGTMDSTITWFRIGDYKLRANEVGGEPTCPPAEVEKRMKALLEEYNSKETKTIEDVIEFHQNFEKIHPFQDGNGRVGRLIMFKECLANNIVPFIINEEHRWYYYRGLKEWNKEKKYLLDTCLSAQDEFRTWLSYFAIKGA